MAENRLTGHNGQSGDNGESAQTKRHFTEPKLTFIEPKLTKHGDATKITGTNGFFGTFVP